MFMGIGKYALLVFMCMIYNCCMDNQFVITAIELQKKKKDRYNIYIDGEYGCSLGAESVVVFKVKEGSTISEDELKKAIRTDNTKYAFDSAVNLLSYKMRTKNEIREKLLLKKIDEDAIEDALLKLESYGYVNDSTYAKEFVASSVASGRYGSKVIEHKLKQKGITDDIIGTALDEYTEDNEREIAAKQMVSLEKKYCGEDKRKGRQKIYSTLLRRGFSYDVINSVLAEDDDFE